MKEDYENERNLRAAVLDREKGLMEKEGESKALKTSVIEMKFLLEGKTAELKASMEGDLGNSVILLRYQ